MLLICVSSVLLNISSSIVHVVLHLLFISQSSPSLSMVTTAGLWFSDSWRENTSLW